eukprot:5371292-Prymnesium_polylepis.2
MDSGQGFYGYCRYKTAPVPNGTLVKDDYECDASLELWVAGMRWATATITSIGYGDIAATNTSERCVALILMLLGAITWGTLAFAGSNQDALMHRRNTYVG